MSVRINVCGDVTLSNGRVLFRCQDFSFPSSRNTTIDSCVAEFQSIYPDGVVNIQVDGRAFPFIDELTQSYPITLVRYPYSINAYNETEERLIKDFLGIDPEDVSPDDHLKNISNDDLSSWFNYWRNLRLQDPNFEPLLKQLYEKYHTGETGFGPIPQPQPTPGQEKTQLYLGLWNPTGYVANAEEIKGKLNFILEPIGWYCEHCITSRVQVSCSFVKRGSPVLPIFAIIALIGIALTGAVIISIKWLNLKTAGEKTAQINDVNDLIEGAMKEHAEGKLSSETLADIISYVSGIDFRPTNNDKDFSLEMFAGLMPFILATVIISMLPKGNNY